MKIQISDIITSMRLANYHWYWFSSPHLTVKRFGSIGSNC